MRNALGIGFIGLVAAACGPQSGAPDFAQSDLSGHHDFAVAADLTTAPDASPSDLAAPPDLTALCSPACSGQTPVCDPRSSMCVPCLPANDTCDVGSYCAGGGDGGVAYACLPGCKVDKECAGDGGSFACCDHQCTDLRADSDNCGKCGSACGLTTCCASHCIDTTKDSSNCGACGKSCSKEPNAMESCTASACVVSGCTMPFADCNMDPSDGCEANLSNDPANCTACGMFCNVANGEGACSNGCVLKDCYAGFADCDKQIGNGCEVTLTSDPKNCGACGTVCPAPPNSTAACTAGVCGPGTCSVGFADCDLQPQNGCEVNLNNDSNNCGMCGKACAMELHAMSTCLNGACSVGSCIAPFADCNHNAMDGCEVDTSSDPNNCAGCGMACPVPANAAATCVQSMCGVGACNNGFADCNQNPNDGCEVNVNSDNGNCGACGNACPVNTICSLGKCATCSMVLIDNPGTLCVPVGMSYALSGDHCYTSQVIINGTLTVSPSNGMTGGSIILRSPTILVSATGKIVGDAAGQLGGTPAPSNGGLAGIGAGAGCGGGPGNSVGQGGTGGAYGGVGGSAKPYSNVGVCDRCNNPTVAHCWGAIATVSGTANGADLDMGSGGGGAGNSAGCANAGGRGGAGGASVLLLGKSVQIDGSVSSNGEQPPPDASQCGYHPGGGGGSGGSVVVRADSLAGMGSLSANGGQGGDTMGMASNWGWAGGGGGGGRVKLFATNSTFAGTMTTTGAVGGTTCAGGECTVGLSGAAGSTNSSNVIPNTWTLLNCGGF